MVSAYFNFKELQNTEHQTTRRYVEHTRQGKTLRSDLEQDKTKWHTQAEQHPGLVSPFAAPRGEVSRIAHTSEAKKSLDSAAQSASGTGAASGGLPDVGSHSRPRK